MPFSFADYQRSASVLHARLGGFVPEVLLILGSGLGGLADELEGAVAVPYREIPHFRPSTAPGHAGRFVFGYLEGRPVAVMQGRMHYYEGCSLEEIAYPVRVARLLGTETMIVTNAAGCVRRDWAAGDLMVISDHIKFFLDSPLRGENLDQFGPRFPDVSTLYTPALRKTALAAASELGLTLREGVYCYFPGPQYETPAEVRAAGILGADAVGMSTVPEALAARHCGMEVLGFSLLTNMAAGILDQPLDGDEVIAAANAAKDRFSLLVRRCVARL